MNRTFFPATAGLWVPLRTLAVITALSACWTSGLLRVDADDAKQPSVESPADEKKTKKSEESSQDNADENAAIKIPDGTAEELFAFAIETMRNRGRDMKSVRRAARAVVDTAAKIRTLDDVTVETEVRAIGLQLPALKFLARGDEEAAEELKELIKSLSEDERPAIQNFAKQDQLKQKVRSISSMSSEERKAFVDEVVKMADDGGLTTELYSLASQLAGALNRAGEIDMAVSLYNTFAERMEASQDERMKEMAERARGAARRVGLLGNTMKLKGVTAQGDKFDWDEYRGRVVLVDFWASWCGPCRAEIPNMKRNLEAYGDDFAIVGINMDQTTQAMQDYVEKENLTWVNLVGDPDTGTGWDHPIARYYGVTGIPTAILVDQKGKVVSLSARGERLDAGLEELLGPPPVKKKSSKEEKPDSEDDSGADTQ